MPTKKDLRIFLQIWGAIFAVIAFYPLFGEGELRIWALVLSVGFLAFSWLKPELFTGFYKLWIKLGEFVGGIISKVIMFVLFYGMFAPIGLLFRILGKDLLHKKMDKEAKSYWIERETQPGSLKNQY